MGGKRLTPEERAHHGPAEDRAKKPQGDRTGKKMRMRGSAPDHGLDAKDEARRKAWEQG